MYQPIFSQNEDDAFNNYRSYLTKLFDFENGRVDGGRTWLGLLLFDSQLFSQAPTWFRSLACLIDLRCWGSPPVLKMLRERAGSSWKACTPWKLWNWFCSAQSALAQRPPQVLLPRRRMWILQWDASAPNLGSVSVQDAIVTFTHWFW